MVKLNDQDEIETREQEQAIQRLISSCGLLCRDPDFQSYLGVDGEDAAVDEIRKRCEISSRSEFKENVIARAKFIEIREDYKKWTK